MFLSSGLKLVVQTLLVLFSIDQAWASSVLHKRLASDATHYDRVHPAKVNATYPVPYSRNNLIWKCDHSISECGILKNRHNFVKFTNAGASLVLNVNSAAEKHLLDSTGRYPNPAMSYNAARLITPYLPSNYSNACLEFSYAWQGMGRKTVTIVQQHDEDLCVYFHESVSEGSSEIKEEQIPIDLRYGPSKFFVEFQFDIDHKRIGSLGQISIHDFSFGFGNCPAPTQSEADCDTPWALGLKHWLPLLFK